MPDKDKRTDAQIAIAEMRTKKGWSQQHLATLLGRATVSIGKWETEREPGVEVLEQLAKFAERHKLPALAFRFRVSSAQRQGYGVKGAEAEFLFKYAAVLQNGHLYKLIGEESDAIHELIERVLIKLNQVRERGESVRGINASDLKWTAYVAERFMEMEKSKKDQQADGKTR